MSQRVGAKRGPMINSAKFDTGEGFVSADRDPSSGPDFVRATFSHKGRRKQKGAALRPPLVARKL